MRNPYSQTSAGVCEISAMTQILQPRQQTHMRSFSNPTSKLKSFAVLFPILCVSACSLLPQHTVSPTSSIVVPQQFSAESATTQIPLTDKQLRQIDAQWWLAINDAQLTKLINTAAKTNFDVRTALERVNQARAGALSIKADVMPSLNLTGSLADNRSGLPEYIKMAGNPDVKSKRYALDFSWGLDLFGGNRAARKAATDDVEAAAWGVKGAQLVAICEVARQYFIYQNLLEKQRIITDMIHSQQQTLALTKHKKAEGLASDFDISRINAEVLNAQSMLPAINTGLTATKNQIALLTGVAPQQLQLTPNIAVLNASALQQAIPAGQPTDLLLRRPDVRAAELQLHAASSRLKQAQANRFPKLFLSAVYGKESLTLNSLALSPAFYANTALAFAMPLIDSGRIKAGINNSKSVESQALINYDKTIVSVLSQVENALTARQDETAKLGFLQSVAQERNKSERHANALFKEGMFSNLQVLEVQRGQSVANLAVLDSQLQQAINTINVYAALGGGWQSFDTTTVASKQTVISKQGAPSAKQPTTQMSASSAESALSSSNSNTSTQQTAR